VNESKLRRYFIGLVGFGFVACWATAGPTVAIAAAVVCALAVLAPDVRAFTASQPRTRTRPRPVRAREVAEEDERPLVPDEPSLIVETVPRW
jgi:hypothetical protein